MIIFKYYPIWLCPKIMPSLRPDWKFWIFQRWKLNEVGGLGICIDRAWIKGPKSGSAVRFFGFQVFLLKYGKN